VQKGFIAVNFAKLTCGTALVAALFVTALPSGRGAPARDTPIVLVPHRAIYDLSLAQKRGNSQIVGVRGRILDNGEGESKISTSDLRSTTWEGGDAKSFKFSSQNFVNEDLVDTVDGHAERSASETAVDLNKPERRTLDLDAKVVFPTEHMVRVIAAARAGETILSFPVYDGSETGDKVFDTLSVIGRPIATSARAHDDAIAKEPRLASMARWPVTISYFDKAKKADMSEQTPAYAIGFELYDNGISRALQLDYNDFVVAGKLTSLELKEAKPCR